MSKARFHLCHILPPGRVYFGLHAYREIAETLLWGLQALGHEATYGQNSTSADAVNLVLGAQMLTPEQLDALPPATVIYNLEQMARVPVDRIRPVMRGLAQRFRIWDYCEANIERWESLGCAVRPLHVKLGWAPILERIARAAPQDIEVLLYGVPGDERMQIFRSLCLSGIRAVFACGLYGAERDSLIARSKLVVNAGAFFTASRIFEIARVSYLLSNAKAVVTDLHPDTIIEPDIRAAVVGSSPQGIVEDCLRLIEDEAGRTALEARGQAIFRARDIREILREPIERGLTDN